MNPGLNWILVVAGVALVLLEILLGAITGFDLLLIGSAIAIGGVAGLLLQSLFLGLVTSGILSILYVSVGRQRLRKRLMHPDIPSNVDALIGRTAHVVEEIADSRPGRIKFEGEEWRSVLDTAQIARPLPIAAADLRISVGSRVRITRVDGVTAYIVPEADPRPIGKDLP